MRGTQILSVGFFYRWSSFDPAVSHLFPVVWLYINAFPWWITGILPTLSLKRWQDICAKAKFFQYIQNLPNPNGLASFASCVVWDLPAIATDRCRSNYSQDRKEKSIIRSFSLRRNPLQPNLLAFSSKARKICPFCLFCYKIGYPPVKFWEAYLSQTFPPKSPQSKDSRRWARTAHGETIRAERAQRGHPSIHHSCSAEAHTQLPSQSFALCVPFYRQKRVLSDSTILEPAKITGAWNWNV